MGKFNKIFDEEEIKYCFKYLNAYDIVSRIDKMSDIDKYILFIYSADLHDYENAMFIHNIKPFKSIMQCIHDFYENGSENGDVIQKLLELYGSDLVPLINLPKILSVNEIRNIRIEDILE